MITLLSMYILIDCGIKKLGIKEYIFLSISLIADLIILPINILLFLICWLRGDFK